MRFSEEMAGCNGFEYVLDFSEKSEFDDEVFVSNGIEIHVKKVKVPALKGSEIDYVEGLRGSGFKNFKPQCQISVWMRKLPQLLTRERLRVTIVICKPLCRPLQGSIEGESVPRPDGLGYDMPALRA